MSANRVSSVVATRPSKSTGGQLAYNVNTVDTFLSPLVWVTVDYHRKQQAMGAKHFRISAAAAAAPHSHDGR